MKILTLFILILFVAVACNNTIDKLHITGKVTLENGNPEIPIEIRFYMRSSDTAMVYAKADSLGNFSMEIPEGNSLNLHISAPGYSGISTQFDRLKIKENEIKCEAFLARMKVPEQDLVWIVGDFTEIDIQKLIIGDNSYAIKMEKREDGNFEAEFERPEDVLNIQYLFHNGVQQQILLGKDRNFFVNTHMPYSQDRVYSYCVKGGYQEVWKSESGMYHIVLKPYFADSTSPTLSSSFNFTSPQKYVDLQDVQSAIESKQKDKIVLLDSLLGEIDDQELRNYLLCQKLKEIYQANGEFDSALAVIRKITDVPASCGTISTEMVGWTEVRDNPGKYFEEFRNIIYNISDFETRGWNGRDFFDVLIKFDDSTGKFKSNYKNELIKLEKEYKDYDLLASCFRGMISKIHLAESDIAPNFVFIDLDGKKHQLSDYRGIWVLLDFYDIGCGACIRDFPYLKDAYEQVDKNKLEIISICNSKNREKVEKYTNSEKFAWISTYNDSAYANPSELYGGGSIPRYFLIDPEGKIIIKHPEDDQLRTEDLLPTLKKHELLKEK
jgi:peroxiredoxin